MTSSDPQRLHILFLPRWYPNTDDPQLGIFIRKHAQAVSLFHQVTLIFPYGLRDQQVKYRIEESSEHGFHEIIVKYRLSACKTAIISRIVNFILYFNAFRKAWSLLSQDKPQLIHVHVLLRPAILALWMKVFHGVPYVITEHWTGYASGKYAAKSSLYQWFCKKAVRGSAGLSVVSQGLKEDMLKHSLVHPLTEVIPNVLDLAEYQFVEKQNRNKTLILTVADLVDRNKNISASLRAVRTLTDRGQAIEFHIAGGGEDEVMLRTLAGELGLSNGIVHFHGRLANEEILSLIPRMDFLLVNSLVETFSVVAAEALGLGIPVIASRCGGPEGFITPKQGLLIEPGNDGELLEALEIMIRQHRSYPPEELAAYARERFSATRTGEMFHRFYQEALKSG